MPISVSVIVVNHVRRKYVSEAVQSVINQTLNRDAFEIIVVSNSKVEVSDGNGHVKVIETEKEPYSEKIVLAVEASGGEVIALLDDDDLFEPEKLERVFVEFRENSSLGYLHNSYLLIDCSGSPSEFPFRQYDLHGSNRNIELTASDIRTIHRLNFRGIDFNHSCISFRSEILRKWKNSLPELTGSFDTFIFLASLEEGYTVKVISDKLTKYRLHSSSNSQYSPDIGKMEKWLDKRILNYSKISEIMKKEGNSVIETVIRSKVFDSLIVRDILKNENRAKIIYDLSQFVLNSRSLERYHLTKVALAILNLFSNTLARRVYLSHVT